jgi:hypothetical protein
MAIVVKKYPPDKSLEEVLDEYITKINKVVSYQLLQGFKWTPPLAAWTAEALTTVGGSPVELLFSTKITDQSNIVETALLLTQAAMSGNAATWTRTWQGNIPPVTQVTLLFDATTWAEFVQQYAIHKESTLAQGWAWKNALRAVERAKDIKTVFKTLGIDDELIREAQQSDMLTDL